MRRRFRRASLAMSGAVVVVVAIGVAYAVAAVGGGGVINGCYKSVNGQLWVIDPATDSCNPSETPISWSQTGPQGPQGPPGPQGPKGDPGSPDTPQQVLDKLKTVDGAGSGLDADLFGGFALTAFQRRITGTCGAGQRDEGCVERHGSPPGRVRTQASVRAVEAKTGRERGRYLHPDLYGKARSASVIRPVAGTQAATQRPKLASER